MRCQLHADRQTNVTCGDCGGPICNQCQHDQQDGRWLCAACVRERVARAEIASRPARHTAPSERAEARPGGGFHSLSTLARVLCAGTVVLGLIGIFDRHRTASEAPSILIGVMGVAAGIFMWRRSALGWMLAMLWALSQVIVVIVGNVPLNTVAGVVTGVTVTVNGYGASLNILAVVFAILLFQIRHEFLGISASQREALT